MNLHYLALDGEHGILNFIKNALICLIQSTTPPNISKCIHFLPESELALIWNKTIVLSIGFYVKEMGFQSLRVTMRAVTLVWLRKPNLLFMHACRFVS